MAIGGRAGVPVLTSLMVANGANAGNLSPWLRQGHRQCRCKPPVSAVIPAK
jgi:hypothetical protein